MRLTINQLRKIIKEEISRSTTHSRRTLREMAEANYSLEINNVTDRAAEVSAIDARYSARSPEYRMATPPSRSGNPLIDKIDRVISENNLLTIDYEQLARRIDPDLIDKIEEVQKF